MKIQIALVSSITLLAFFLSNCSKEDTLSGVPSEPESVAEEAGLCTELYDDDHSRAFGTKSAFWTKNTLRVRFLGGSSYVQSKVRQHAVQWSQYANMNFEFVDSEPSDIRISFDEGSGSWSYVGRNNQYISSQRATMNFGWFTDRTSDTEFRRTTLHEFGHALGLSHEHQHPLADIDWNVEAVYAYYSRTQDWSRSDVDNNIFDKYGTGNTNYSAYDPLSIMHYYIPRSLVVGNWTARSNSTLSSTDQAFIQAMYPGGGDSEDPVLSCTCPEELDVIACDDFEAYDQESFDEGPTWGTWAASSGSAELQTYDWGKVIKLQYAEVANPDVLYFPGSLDEGVYTMQWDMYVGSNNTAYFNVQKDKVVGSEFGVQVFFDGDASGRLTINGRETGFEYKQNTWNKIKLSLDFDSNEMSFGINDVDLVSWPLSWSATSAFGAKRFEALNFYAIDRDARFWLDEFCISQGGEVAALANNFVAAQTNNITEK